MSVSGHEQPRLPDWSEPRVPKVRLTHRNIHFLIAPGDVAMQASVIVGLAMEGWSETKKGRAPSPPLHNLIASARSIANHQIFTLFVS